MQMAISVGTIVVDENEKVFSAKNSQSVWSQLESSLSIPVIHNTLLKAVLFLLVNGFVTVEYSIPFDSKRKLRIHVIPDDSIKRPSLNLPQNLKIQLVNSRKILYENVSTCPEAWHIHDFVDASIPTTFNLLSAHSSKTETSLFKLFSSISTTTTSPHERIIPYLKTNLFAYQRKSVSKMLSRESPTTTHLDLTLTKHYDILTNEPYYIDDEKMFLEVFQHPVYYADVQGGILCEDMGTGKTLICIAVILSTLNTRSSPPSLLGSTKLQLDDEFVLGVQRYCGRTRGNNGDSLFLRSLMALVSQPISFSSILSMVPSSFRSVLKRLWEKNPPFYVTRDYNIDDYAALACDDDITANTDALEVEQVVNNNQTINTERYSKKKQKSEKKMYVSSATLIIVPDTLLDQWQTQFNVHTDLNGNTEDGEGVRYLVLTGNMVTPPANILSVYEIVLTSYSRFARELSQVDDMDGEKKSKKSRKVKAALHTEFEENLEFDDDFIEEDGAVDRNQRTRSPNDIAGDYGGETESPFFRVRFLRLVIDEGHFLGKGGVRGRVVEGVKRLSVERRWACTGTPLPYGIYGGYGGVNDVVDDEGDLVKAQKGGKKGKGRGKGKRVVMVEPKTKKVTVQMEKEKTDLKALEKLCVEFLGVMEFQKGAKRSMFTELIITPFLKRKQIGYDRLKKLLNRVMVKNHQNDIEKDVSLPELHERVVRVEMNSFQRMIHNCIIAFFVVNSVLSERKDQDYLFHPSNKKSLYVAVDNLQASCFWFGSQQTTSLTVLQNAIDVIADEYSDLNTRQFTESDKLLLETAKQHLLTAINSPVIKSLHRIFQKRQISQDPQQKSPEPDSSTPTKTNKRKKRKSDDGDEDLGDGMSSQQQNLAELLYYFRVSDGLRTFLPPSVEENGVGSSPERNSILNDQNAAANTDTGIFVDQKENNMDFESKAKSKVEFALKSERIDEEEHENTDLKSVNNGHDGEDKIVEEGFVLIDAVESTAICEGSINPTAESLVEEAATFQQGAMTLETPQTTITDGLNVEKNVKRCLDAVLEIDGIGVLDGVKCLELKQSIENVAKQEDKDGIRSLDIIIALSSSNHTIAGKVKESVQLMGAFSTKMVYIANQIMRYSDDEKMIIYTQWDNEIYHISEFCKIVGKKHLIFSSQLNKDTRSHSIVTFNTSPTHNIFIMNLKLASWGIDLSSASRVIFCSPVWQVAMERQAIKRAHRIGCKRDVYVETLVSRGSYEEDIAREKREMNLEGHKDNTHIAQSSKFKKLIESAKFIYPRTSSSSLSTNQIPSIPANDPQAGIVEPEFMSFDNPVTLVSSIPLTNDQKNTQIDRQKLRTATTTLSLVSFADREEREDATWSLQNKKRSIPKGKPKSIRSNTKRKGEDSSSESPSLGNDQSFGTTADEILEINSSSAKPKKKVRFASEDGYSQQQSMNLQSLASSSNVFPPVSNVRFENNVLPTSSTLFRNPQSLATSSIVFPAASVRNAQYLNYILPPRSSSFDHQMKISIPQERFGTGVIYSIEDLLNPKLN
ncbi:hypothetical protein HK098_002593 [Nowakowskiella sp. JEL0407]|nr:hypothetical protein HK098_002593 [Nowakowskiella sp. JEL0407]